MVGEKKGKEHSGPHESVESTVSSRSLVDSALGHMVSTFSLHKIRPGCSF